ncbi:short-chain dehydrogenase [Aspergillus saccharolyticus JOP 1030-1]|uniref:Short-chain dehydrogenase n=1 Tax=Aspergillus saccharolyticus JOP 1030-1 TaxID=1450539 RepID=A0A318Z9B5_9EURO|nr:short-chain dehydrogenase [Aspergillus saccharolyticus JOP 1030-1]PYH43916.1 short-chain dehydrogenase [Aspergillus saccharolyticus JOP 1030-1]
MATMTGTVVLTGANGSLALPLVEHLLLSFPQLTLVLTVRNPSADSTDVHTKHLLDIVGPHRERVHVRALDLARLSETHAFAETLAADIAADRLPPVISIICNAFYWNLKGEVTTTPDGFETTWQVTYLSHVALILRLLRSFGPAGGRIVLFSSDAHFPGKNGLEVYPPALPENLDSFRLEPMSVPESHKAENALGRGFQRYAIAKLAVTTWMYALNARLEATTGPLHKITALAVNPGNLSDSRALQVNTPAKLQFIARFILQPFRPLLQYKDRTIRTAAEAALDVAALAVGPAFAGARGYFTLRQADTSSAESRDPKKQQQLWEKTLEWVGMTEEQVGPFE